MATYTTMIEALESSNDISQKARMMQYLIQCAKSQKPTPADMKELSELAFRLMDQMMQAIPAAPDYRTKSFYFDLEDKTLGLLMTIYGAPDKLPQEKLPQIRDLVTMVRDQQVLEGAIIKLFEQETVYPAYVEQLINLHRSLTDEFQKGQLYAGLLNYGQEGKVTAFSDECKTMLGDYIASEVERYLSAPLYEQVIENLEIVVDVARYLPTEKMVEQIYALLPLGHTNINYYAVATLLKLDKDVPADVVAKLAENLTYANLTYHALKDHGKASLFPAEFSNEEYLAKSDLVHWLTYPTELGKEPDAIEYLGKVKVKKENYWVFRFKSNSDTLDDEHQNRWLIGWSGDEGGTFSEFDLYELYEKKTPEKTLKYIKKKLL